MNLKEAFRYQNKIQALMCEAENILRNRANITKVTNTNLRHKVMPEASDETVVEIPETEYCGKITDVALFLVFLLEEKSALAAAIRRAKNNLDIDMDSEVALNSARQTVADEMSAKLDICMVTSSVDYTPPFDVNSGFADAFENYLENRC